MKSMQRSAAQSAVRIRGGAGRDRSRGVAATAAGRLRVAAVLCSLLFVTLWLTGCEQVFVLNPKMTVTAQAVLGEAGPPLEFTVRVSPAPTKDLTFHVEVDAEGCVLPEQLRQSRTVTIAAGVEEITLAVPTEGIRMGAAGCTVAVTVTERDSAQDGTDSAQAPLHLTVLITVPDQVPDPVVTVAAGPSPVAEGTDVSFTLTATPAPAAPLTVAVSWSETGSFLTGTPSETVTIPTTGTATVSASTESDEIDEADGSVTLTVTGGDGYTVGTPASASVTVTDETVPAVSVAAGPSPVAEGTDVSFTLTATPAPAAPLAVAVSWSEMGSFLTGTPRGDGDDPDLGNGYRVRVHRERRDRRSGRHGDADRGRR